MVTRNDVAALAGVSGATVTYVLNGKKRFSREVEERVRAAAKTLKYTPNLNARSLKGHRSNHLAVIVNHLDNPYYAQLLKGSQAAAIQKGYLVSALMMEAVNDEWVNQLSARGVDGVYISMETSSHQLESAQLTMPVLLGTELRQDFHTGVYQMVDRLTELGHTRIACLSGLDTRDARFYELKSALEQRGLTLPESLVVDNPPTVTPSVEAGYNSTKTLLKRKVPFTAIFAHNDLMAQGALCALRESGLSVPDDVSVVGCDGLSGSRYLNPPLATMEGHAYRTGEVIAEALIARVEHQEFEVPQISFSFIERESIGRAKK